MKPLHRSPGSSANSSAGGDSASPFGLSAGQVALVGAGPGEPSAITLRAIECLQSADVVLYDYLVNPSLLQWTRTGAELVSLGRHGTDGKRLLTQNEVNQLMVDRAQAGCRVVRLKSGDPIVFARMSEETEVLQEAGIPCEIVPGVTSALAAGSFAGIPLTHRDHASAVALVTGHRGDSRRTRDPGGETNSGCPSHLDWQALARFPGTLVVYMGTTQVEYWVDQLLTGGMSGATPVAIVRRCGFSDQTVRHCRLDELVRVATQPKRIRPPVVFVIGQVAAAEATCNWFQQRPLFNQQVLVTRPAHQSEPMCRELERLGAGVIQWPAIQTIGVDDQSDLADSLNHLEEFDWIVFSSANGVDFWMRYLWDSGHDARTLNTIRIACIGRKTQQALEQYCLRSDLVPETFDADHLAAQLAAQGAGKRFLLIRASRGREILAETLEQAGAVVRQVVVYQSQDTDDVPTEIGESLKSGQIQWVTVTSSAIARNLVRRFGDDLRRARLASISPITTQTLRELGFEVGAEASEYTSTGLIQAICQAVRSTSAND